MHGDFLLRTDDRAGGEPLRSGLDERVGSLVSLLCDVKMMEAQMREAAAEAG